LIVPEYYKQVEETGDLVTQEDFYNNLIDLWPDYYSGLTENQKNGFRTRIFNLIYPSAVDQIYAQSLLIESNHFDRVFYPEILETAGIDLAAVPRFGTAILIGLSVNTTKAINLDEHRPGRIQGMERVAIRKPIRQRERSHGGMYWYELSDFQPLFSMIDSGNDWSVTA
jgi:hypothetical protein